VFPCATGAEVLMNVPAKADLSPARRRLLERMQRLNFGRIERLRVRGGQPVFDPAPAVVREVKFGGENGPRPELARRDFLIKAQLADFFRQLDDLGDGVIDLLEVKHGLPFRMLVAEAPAGA
jgi:hypothetical protein